MTFNKDALYDAIRKGAKYYALEDCMVYFFNSKGHEVVNYHYISIAHGGKHRVWHIPRVWDRDFKRCITLLPLSVPNSLQFILKE